MVQKISPLNRFASDLWLKKELLEPDIVRLLEDFDLDTAVQEFTRYLEKEGFIKNYFLDYFYLVENDTLKIDEADAGENNQRFIGISQADFSLLSSDEQEVLLERAGIMEFDGGVSRLEAEKQAYKAILNETQDLMKERDINYSVVVQARSYCQN
ncbi:hypothetical protein [Methylobacter sp. BlB1]|uniref:hypothetical protein n=1 Tax=Methylobacter sp. BlB1 TaxID=2785914 RepID=UPI00189613C4|nr:hypothetical protein [Methylobacter sp. BlB1]MBF6650707.1 hypothetical protein [Methylobacter sp. BlB1]